MPLDSVHPKSTSITSRITGYNSLIIITCLLAFAWLVHTQLQWSIHQQADALGDSLLQQTHTAAEGALSVKDTLSVAVLLRELVDNPYVSYAALENTDNRILAEAGKRPKLKNTGTGFYSKQLSYQNNTAGSLHLQIDLHKLQQPLTTSMQSMAALGLALLLLALFLSVHLGRSVAVPLQALSNWLINPVPPAPHTERSDEVGLLARQLNQYFITDTQTDETDELEPTDQAIKILDEPHSTPDVELSLDSEDSDESTAPALHIVPSTTPSRQPAPAASHSTTLAVELGNMEQLRQLPKERLIELIKKYRTAVKKSAALYGGHLHSLADGRNLIVFNSDHTEYPRNAVCCGELLRAFGHSLQIEVADSGIALQIQLGLSEGPAIQDISLGELLLSPSVQTALSLSQHSRNLLLLSDDLAQNSEIADCARTRVIAQPKDTQCLDSLLPPYSARLEEQLRDLQEASQSSS